VLAAVGPSLLAGRRALLIHSSTGFGQEGAAGAPARPAEWDLSATDIAFDPGLGAVAAADALFRCPANDVVLVAGAFDDELAIADRLLRRAWRTAGFVSASVDGVLQPLAERLEGATVPASGCPRRFTQAWIERVALFVGVEMTRGGTVALRRCWAAGRPRVASKRVFGGAIRNAARIL
jgi:hypothetical protein